jgi:hypothetical protein
MLRKVALVSVALLGLLGACKSPGDSSPAPAQTTPTAAVTTDAAKTMKCPAKSDDQIAREVFDLLRTQFTFKVVNFPILFDVPKDSTNPKPKLHIHVSSECGVVKIQGYFPDDPTQLKVIRTAMSVADVRGVNFRNFQPIGGGCDLTTHFKCGDMCLEIGSSCPPGA